jgi:ABC-2 type transport system ATP-binding protein
MNVIETHALSKSYGSTRALHECTLAIPDGHVVALVGPNGRAYGLRTGGLY